MTLIRSICATLLLGLAAAPVKADGIAVTGKAFDLDSGDLVYSEHHRIVRDGNVPTSHDVEYRDADGQPFAHKTVDYSRSPFSPTFETVDNRIDYVEGARYDGQEYLIYREPPGDNERETKRLSPRKARVTDAGFDIYVRKHFEQLRAGETIEFRLCVPGGLAEYKFRARTTGTTTVDGREGIKIRVEPDSLLRFLVDPLNLVYALDPLQLLVYEGRTNIKDADGEPIDARIVFGKQQPLDKAPNE